MTKKATKNGANKVVLAILVEMPEDAKKAIMRPDEAGRDGAFEYRVLDDLGAFVEMEVNEAACGDGMQLAMTEKEARAATRLLGTSFVTRKQAAAIKAVVGGSASERSGQAGKGKALVSTVQIRGEEATELEAFLAREGMTLDSWVREWVEAGLRCDVGGGQENEPARTAGEVES